MGNTSNAPNYNDTILDDVDYDLVQAGGWTRFGNLILDSIFFNICQAVFMAIYGMFESETARLTHTEGDMGYFWGRVLTQVLLSLFYYFAFETLTGGKTIGKYLTGTRAVNEDGTRISTKTALLRSLIRMIPFEFLSALGSPCYPWHDRWTKTYVVDERRSRLPPQL
jgi:uncharacterized RDD family membrane protein YckC